MWVILAPFAPGPHNNRFGATCAALINDPVAVHIGGFARSTVVSPGHDP
jgi:hypothetical protein